jgi:N-methylhydantoinase B
VIFRQRHLDAPEWPAATSARSFVLLRCLGLLAGVVAQAVDGRMPGPGDHPLHGFWASTRLASHPLREVMGGGSGGRY